ncbi:Initiation factor 2B-related protein [Penicillium griseofulvum]|uniref:Initiation factor 2B-related protein n=1 Tax=Penicillium patulum TaxID=5078 RepID=A0A135LHM8_PENPA|nr:Initiation factor 2B-related protein [Penicillium griseofulvum]KXG48471.1 Initiation factor 2B-related protein [Penicillium griseofulvum]
MNQSKELKKRSVVSSFICSDEGEIKVALFRRSEKVATYQHHLAPISGSIESNETPSAAAWREITEETTLTERDLEVWRQGKPYTFCDPSVGRQWTIFPFLFRLKTCREGGRGEEGIQIDWEHEGWQWFSPDTVKDDEKFGGVPRLKESLRRVWFEGEMNERASKALISGLAELKADHQSGSHELTSIALKAFRDVIAQMSEDIDTKWWETARMAAWHLWKNGRESMGAATLNAFLGLLADMEEIVPQTLNGKVKLERLLALLDHHLSKRKEMPMRIKSSFATYLRCNFLPTSDTTPSRPLVILSFSASSTIRDSILEAFASLPISNLELRILESRPLCEGVTMASSILSAFQSRFPSSSDRHLKLTVYTDASAALASNGVDFVLLGADRISDSGAVCPSAKVLVLSELEKVAEPGADGNHSHEKNDPKELLSCWVDSGMKGIKALVEGTEMAGRDNINYTVEVKNIYFEWISANLIDAYICEEGTLYATAIQEKAQQVKQKADKYFVSFQMSKVFQSGIHTFNVLAKELTFEYVVHRPSKEKEDPHNLIVVQCPGWGLGSEYLENGLKALWEPEDSSTNASRYTVIFFHSRGTDGSSRPVGSQMSSMPDLASDLENLRHHLHLERYPVLLGHSNGGAIVLGYAEMYPSRVGKLVLLDHQLDAWDSMLVRKTDTDEDFTESVRGMWPLHFFHPQQYVPQLLRDIGDRKLSVWCYQAQGRCDKELLDPMQMVERLGDVQAETLIIFGRQDMICGTGIAERTAKDIQNARLITYGECGHFPWIEKREQTILDIRNFIQEAD